MIWVIGGKDIKMMVGKKIYPNLKEVPKSKIKEMFRINDNPVD
jgi:hypothetical protein